MGMVSGLENATAELLAYTPEQEEDRMGDTVDVPGWTTIAEIRVRFQTTRELQRGEYGRFVVDQPTAFIEPSEIDDDLHETHPALDGSDEWPYVSPDQGRVTVDGTPYEIESVGERSLNLSGPPDVLVLTLTEVE